MALLPYPFVLIVDIVADAGAAVNIRNSFLLIFYRLVAPKTLLRPFPQPNLAVLSVKRDSIAADFPIPFRLQFIHIPFIVYLPQGLFRIVLQVMDAVRDLYFQHKRLAPQGRAPYTDIRAPIARLPVGLHQIVLALAQDSGQEPVVEIFRTVIETDGREKLAVQYLAHLFRVPVLHGPVQVPEVLLLYPLPEPPQNRVPVDCLHFRIWDAHLQECR